MVHYHQPTLSAHRKSVNFFVYICTRDPLCYDFNNGHLCKHIHRVHSIIQSKTQKPDNDGADSHAISALTGDILDEDLDDILNENSDTGSDIDFLSYAEPCKQPSQGMANLVGIQYLNCYYVYRCSSKTQNIQYPDT